jgi:hypothetical protein
MLSWIVGPLGVLHYEFSIWSLVRWLFAHLRRFLAREPTPLIRFEKILDDGAAAYMMLAGSITHIRTLRVTIEKAINLRPILPQHALYLLDHIEASHEM